MAAKFEEARLLSALNGGTQDGLLEGFILDFIHGGSDSDFELTDDEEDHGIVFDQINSS